MEIYFRLEFSKKLRFMIKDYNCKSCLELSIGCKILIFQTGRSNLAILVLFSLFSLILHKKSSLLQREYYIFLCNFTQLK